MLRAIYKKEEEPLTVILWVDHSILKATDLLVLSKGTDLILLLNLIGLAVQNM